MALPFPSEWVVEKNLPAQPDPFLWLIEVTNPDGNPLVDSAGQQTVARITPNPVPVVFGVDDLGLPLTWVPYPVTFDQVAMSSDGSITGLQVSIGNVLSELMALAIANDLFRNHRVSLILVHSAHLSNPALKTTIKATVAEMAADSKAMTFRLSFTRALNHNTPVSLLTRTCRHVYRDALCQFVGDPTGADLGDCALTFEACEARGTWESDNGLEVKHPQQFGGAPALAVGPAPVTGVT